MAYTPWDTYVDTVPVPTTIEELQQALQLKYNTTWPEIANQITSLGGDPTNFDELADLCGLGSIKSADGKSTMWYYKDSLDDFSYTPVSSVSTNTYTSRSTVQTPMNTSIDDVTGKVTVSNVPKSGSFAQDAIYVFGEVGQAVGATATGISLGKAIDARLYNANPEFWDSIGMSSLNPETWASITAGDTSLGATLFNFVFGIDAENGTAQAYMDADAYAYMAYWMKTQGVFNAEETIFNVDTSGAPEGITINNLTPIAANPTFIGEYNNEGAVTVHYADYSNNASPVYCIALLFMDDLESSWNRIMWYFFSENTFTVNSHGLNDLASNVVSFNSNGWYTYNNKTVYYLKSFTTYNSNFRRPYPTQEFNDYLGVEIGSVVSPPTDTAFDKYLWTLLYSSTVETSGGVEGITTQPNAQLPDTSTWSDIPSTDAYLRSAYPDLYSDALQYDALQPDGSVLTKTYIPVPMPDNITSPDTQHMNTPWNNQQPTSDDATQTSTEIDISTSPDDFIKQLIKTITQTVQTTNTDNPTTTGTGESAPLVPIAGTSTALWSVYNPTKSQINSFGAWLWTDNVIQQFIQLLNNPMEGIITLHKVFATPVISGTGTIVVGRLDSGVGSNLVSQQYVDVDCGSVRLDEYFGNVFDYSPHTTISLYLPFIGFVPLNVDDVMRSTISISYGVDVFTGACLATVNVDRDGNSVGLYQYSGVASVEYPLTGAQHGGLVNGLLGVAGGVAGIALASTGVGVVAGASAIAGGLTNAAKTSNARSGGFSGNAGAMGVKIPYLIIERPITKVANTFDVLNGYPTNHNARLGDCSGNVIVKYVHVDGINATEQELSMIESMLKSGVVV